MIVVCTDPPEDAKRLTRIVGETDVSVVKKPYGLRAALRDAECLILGYRGRFLEQHLVEISELERRFPSISIILVTEREPRVARWLSQVRLASVVWYRAVGTSLPVAIRDARTHTAFERMAAAVETSLPTVALRRALPLALRRCTTSPFRSMTDLADEVGCSPITLSQQFRAYFGTDVTLSGLLNALVVLRCHHLRLTGLAWRAVGSHVNLRRETLHRKTRQWPGCTLSELESLDPRDLLARFFEEQMRPILGVRAKESSQTHRRWLLDPAADGQYSS